MQDHIKKRAAIYVEREKLNEDEDEDEWRVKDEDEDEGGESKQVGSQGKGGVSLIFFCLKFNQGLKVNKKLNKC